MRSTKKVVILTYSYTGNTNYAAQLLCKSLSSQDALPTEDDLDCERLSHDFPVVKDSKSVSEVSIPGSPYRFVIMDFVPVVRYVSFSKGQANTVFFFFPFPLFFILFLFILLFFFFYSLFSIFYLIFKYLFPIYYHLLHYSLIFQVKRGM